MKTTNKSKVLLSIVLLASGLILVSIVVPLKYLWILSFIYGFSLGRCELVWKGAKIVDEADKIMDETKKLYDKAIENHHEAFYRLREMNRKSGCYSTHITNPVENDNKSVEE